MLRFRGQLEVHLVTHYRGITFLVHYVTIGHRETFNLLYLGLAHRVRELFVHGQGCEVWRRQSTNPATGKSIQLHVIVLCDYNEGEIPG